MTPATLQALKDFRSDPTKVKAWQKVLAMPITVEVMNLLESVAPHNEGIVNKINAEYNAVTYGNVLGYSLRANREKDLAIPVREQANVEADYAEGN